MEQALFKAGIPACISKTGSVFESKEAISMTDLLSAVLEPERSNYIKAALSSDLFKLSGNEIFELNTDEEAWFQWQNQFREWKNIWNEYGFIRMIQSIFHSPKTISSKKGKIEKKVEFFHL